MNKIYPYYRHSSMYNNPVMIDENNDWGHFVELETNRWLYDEDKQNSYKIYKKPPLHVLPECHEYNDLKNEKKYFNDEEDMELLECFKISPYVYVTLGTFMLVNVLVNMEVL
jgi:hypothetical protein